MENVYGRDIHMSALNAHAKSEAHRATHGRICPPPPHLHHHHHHLHQQHQDVSSLALPETLYDGSKTESLPRDDPDDHPGMKKRRFSASRAAMNDGGGAGASTSSSAAAAGGKAEVLGLIMQKNNSRVVQLLVDAESGRNARHAASVALARKQLKLDERRLQMEQNLLEQERARLDAHVRLGQSFIAALTDIGDGLKRIGNAMEAAKT